MNRAWLAVPLACCPFTGVWGQNSEFLRVKSVTCYSGDSKVYEGTNVGITANPAVMPGPGTTLVIKERDGSFTIIHGASAICVMNWKPETLKPAVPQQR